MKSTLDRISGNLDTSEEGKWNENSNTNCPKWSIEENWEGMTRISACYRTISNAQSPKVGEQGGRKKYFMEVMAGYFQNLWTPEVHIQKAQKIQAKDHSKHIHNQIA